MLQIYTSTIIIRTKKITDLFLQLNNDSMKHISAWKLCEVITHLLYKKIYHYISDLKKKKHTQITNISSMDKPVA